MTTYATQVPWVKPGKTRYGIEASYRAAAAWLSPCATIADWGGGAGQFRRYLPPWHRYTLVDGTDQGVRRQVIVDLVGYRVPSDGILLRHVLDCTFDWRAVLASACAAFRRRLCVVTFTPAAEATVVDHRIGAWPVTHFAEADLRAAFADGRAHLADVVVVRPGPDEQQYAPERVYCLERA